MLRLKRKNWFGLILVNCLLAIFPLIPLQATNSYYDDPAGTDDILGNVFVAGGCSGCHTASNASCVNTISTDLATSYLGYTGVRNCYNRIIDRLNGVGNGAQMPQGGPFGNNANYISFLGTWNTANRPLSPATAINPTHSSVDNNSAALSATFDTNTLAGGSYRLTYGLATSYTNGGTIFNNVSRNFTSPTTPAAVTTGASFAHRLCST